MEIARRHAIGTLAALFELTAAAARGQTPQPTSQPTPPARPPVFKHDLPNVTLDNWEVIASHVDFPPGRAGQPHKHRGFLFAYVLEGTVVIQVLGDGVPSDE